MGFDKKIKFIANIFIFRKVSIHSTQHYNIFFAPDNYLIIKLKDNKKDNNKDNKKSVKPKSYFLSSF